MIIWKIQPIDILCYGNRAKCAVEQMFTKQIRCALHESI
jgi:hypothetical protein